MAANKTTLGELESGEVDPGAAAELEAFRSSLAHRATVTAFYQGRPYRAIVTWVGKTQIEVVYHLKNGSPIRQRVHASRVKIGSFLADALTRKHTAFSSLAEMAGRVGDTYRPTIRQDDVETILLGCAYDAYQYKRRDNRRAWPNTRWTLEPDTPGAPRQWSAGRL